MESVEIELDEQRRRTARRVIKGDWPVGDEAR
jgi:hypothetical protein